MNLSNILKIVTKPCELIMKFRTLLTAYPVIVTASLFLIYLTLLILAYFLGKQHGISYKRYRKDITMHNSRIKSIAKTCRILNILIKRTNAFSKMVCVLGVIGYFVDLSQVWSKNYGKGQMAGFRTEMLLQSLDTTKFALICVLVAILFSSIVSYVLRRRVTKERNKIKLSKSKRSGFIEKMLQDLGKELTAALEQFFGDTLLSQIAELKSEVNECILKI